MWRLLLSSAVQLLMVTHWSHALTECIQLKWLMLVPAAIPDAALLTPLSLYQRFHVHSVFAAAVCTGQDAVYQGGAFFKLLQWHSSVSVCTQQHTDCPDCLFQESHTCLTYN
jgi:hypothetical protein